MSIHNWDTAEKHSVSSAAFMSGNSPSLDPRCVTVRTSWPALRCIDFHPYCPLIHLCASSNNNRNVFYYIIGVQHITFFISLSHQQNPSWCLKRSSTVITIDNCLFMCPYLAYWCFCAACLVLGKDNPRLIVGWDIFRVTIRLMFHSMINMIYTSRCFEFWQPRCEIQESSSS